MFSAYKEPYVARTSILHYSCVTSSIDLFTRLFLPTPTDGSRRDRFFRRLSVCFFRTMYHKPTQLRSPNLTWKYSTMSPGNAFILGVKK